MDFGVTVIMMKRNRGVLVLAAAALLAALPQGSPRCAESGEGEGDSAKAAPAPPPEPEPGFSAANEQLLGDQGILAFEVYGDLEGEIRRFILSFKRGVSVDLPTGAIVIVLPHNGDPVRGRQLRLKAAEPVGTVFSWEVSDQLRAAAALGAFPIRPPEGSTFMIHFLKGKGESIGTPLSASWQKT